MAPRRPMKRTLRLLFIMSLVQLCLGGVLMLPIPLWGHWLKKTCGIASIVAGACGVMGLTFTWYRLLLGFTLVSWGCGLISTIEVIFLIVDCAKRHCESNPFAWIVWLCLMLASLPAALLASSMHVLRVWRPQPAVTDTSEPLVAAAADNEPSLAPMPVTMPGAGAPRPPVWPPSDVSVSISGDDLRAAGRVAHVAHSGQGAFSSGDLAKAAKVASVAASASWPPPPPRPGGA